MKENKTTELLNILNSVKDPSKLNEYLNSTISPFQNIDFVNYFENIFKNKSIKKSEVIRNAEIERTYAYQILNGSKNPSRDKIIQLCISAKLDLDETQRALKLGNANELYAKNTRDSVVIYGINNDLSISEIDELLYELDIEETFIKSE